MQHERVSNVHHCTILRMSALTNRDMKDVFRTVDSDGSGEITFDEFLAFRNSGKDEEELLAKREKEAEELKTEMERQAKEEAEEAASDIRVESIRAILSGIDPLKLRDSFSKFDRDNSGTLEAGEFEAFVNVFASITVLKADVEKLINAIDKDGEGTVNFQELARYCNQGGRAEAAKVELVRAKLKVLERKN